MDISQYLQKALDLTMNNEDFVSYNLSDKEFGQLLKAAEGLCQDLANEHGVEGLEALCQQLGENEDHSPAAEFFESVCFEED